VLLGYALRLGPLLVDTVLDPAGLQRAVRPQLVVGGIREVVLSQRVGDQEENQPTPHTHTLAPWTRLRTHTLAKSGL
jgi:hypothetical protein